MNTALWICLFVVCAGALAAFAFGVWREGRERARRQAEIRERIRRYTSEGREW